MIAVASRSFSQNDVLRKEILSRYKNVKFNDSGKSLSGNELVTFLKDANRAIIALEKLDAEILDQLPNLNLISKYGVGLDNIPFKELLLRNIKLSWTSGVNRRSVAELALNFILLTLRRSNFSNLSIKNNNWHQVQGNTLTGKTVGIIGLGHIGQELALLLKPFEVRIIANDILDRSKFAEDHNIELVDKDFIYSTADVISLHLPLTTRTKNLIDSHVMSSFRPNCVLINTARGGLIDEEALLGALKNAQVAGAALDVFKDEPHVNLELLNHPNFFCTSHIGGSSKEAILLMGMAAIEGLENGKSAELKNFFEYPLD